MNDVVEKAGDGEGADATEFWRDGGEVGAVADVVRDVTFKDAVFAGGASIDDAGTGFYHRINN